MIYAKNFDYIIESTFPKINNIILVFIKRKFIILWGKNTLYYIFKKRVNAKIMNTYYLNTFTNDNNLIKKLLFLLIYLFSLFILLLYVIRIDT